MVSALREDGCGDFCKRESIEKITKSAVSVLNRLEAIDSNVKITVSMVFAATVQKPSERLLFSSRRTIYGGMPARKKTKLPVSLHPTLLDAFSQKP
ncbi:MAG: hypothetical protein FWG27_03230 [Treponema sp.]|jgi:hypothetical protein|nr:hypothetical protein [Treponema sp.]